MSETTRKSFYIFLTMLLGVLLFVTVQRSVFILAFLLQYDINSIFAKSLEVLSSALAVTVGAWYGVWLGLLWYKALYEDGTTRGTWGVLKDFGSKRGKTEQGDWEIDDLVALESVDPKSKKPTVEYLEAGAVKWRGRGPVLAEEDEELGRGVLQKKRVVKKNLLHSRAVKKSVS